MFELLIPRMRTDLLHSGALTPILVQHSSEEVLAIGRDMGEGGKVEFETNNLFVHFATVIGPEGVFAGDTDVEDDAHGPDVGGVTRVGDGLRGGV